MQVLSHRRATGAHPPLSVRRCENSNDIATASISPKSQDCLDNGQRLSAVGQLLKTAEAPRVGFFTGSARPSAASRRKLARFHWGGDGLWLVFFGTEALYGDGVGTEVPGARVSGLSFLQGCRNPGTGTTLGTSGSDYANDTCKSLWREPASLVTLVLGPTPIAHRSHPQEIRKRARTWFLPRIHLTTCKDAYSNIGSTERMVAHERRFGVRNGADFCMHARVNNAETGGWTMPWIVTCHQD